MPYFYFPSGQSLWLPYFYFPLGQSLVVALFLFSVGAIPCGCPFFIFRWGNPSWLPFFFIFRWGNPSWLSSWLPLCDTLTLLFARSSVSVIKYPVPSGGGCSVTLKAELG
ncbi:MAG: hypothetical protein IPL33_00625 [Sphingobacteriales bacterium]|nr:hypothetical protein [Sphingobacteriales bacterium]